MDKSTFGSNFGTDTTKKLGRKKMEMTATVAAGTKGMSKLAKEDPENNSKAVTAQ